jgi:hypothetical protein
MACYRDSFVNAFGKYKKTRSVRVAGTQPSTVNQSTEDDRDEVWLCVEAKIVGLLCVLEDSFAVSLFGGGSGGMRKNNVNETWP